MTVGLMLSAALGYAEQGWPIFPCVPKQKYPLTAHGFKDGVTDEQAIRQMWERCPDANIGVVTGTPSRLVVFDVDGIAGEHSLDEIQKTHGELPETAEAKTGHGGRHLLFLHPGERVRNRTGIRPGLDVRGDGGYIVAPPSYTVAPYQWLRDPSETELAPVPNWFLALIRQPRSGPPGTSRPWAAEKRREIVADPYRYAQAAFARELVNLANAPIGQRNAILNNAAFALGAFVQGSLLDAELVERCLHEIALKIGLPTREVERTIASGLQAGTLRRQAPFVRGRLISQLLISTRGKLALYVLDHHAARDGWSWPSQRTLMHECSFGGFRTLMQVLDEIKHFVEVRPMTGGRGRPRNSYRLRWDVIEKAARVFAPDRSSLSFPSSTATSSPTATPLRMESCSALTVGAKGTCKGARA